MNDRSVKPPTGETEWVIDLLAALTISIIAGLLAFVGGRAISAQDKYTVKVPNGLSFSEFRGYEAWQVVSISQESAYCGGRG